MGREPHLCMVVDALYLHYHDKGDYTGCSLMNTMLSNPYNSGLKLMNCLICCSS